MFSHDQLIFAVAKLHPNLQHGKDFWAAHPVETGSAKQLAEAEIIAWRAKGISQPGTDVLRETFAEHADEWHASEHRLKRGTLLTGSDWTQTQDLPEDFRKRWAEYRKALREMPKQQGFPRSVDWPDPPVE